MNYFFKIIQFEEANTIFFHSSEILYSYKLVTVSVLYITRLDISVLFKLNFETSILLSVLLPKRSNVFEIVVDVNLWGDFP